MKTIGLLFSVSLLLVLFVDAQNGEDGVHIQLEDGVNGNYVLSNRRLILIREDEQIKDIGPAAFLNGNRIFFDNQNQGLYTILNWQFLPSIDVENLR